MTGTKGPSKKVRDKHARFLAAWDAAGFPDHFEYEGASLNNLRPVADWYREQKQRSTLPAPTPPRTK
jgi:hypothetical protein